MSRMYTHTGKFVDPLALAPAEVDVVDIAHALSLTCRYNGHCSEFYSVAQHAVLMSENAPEALKFACLHHDDTEAYIGDMVRPLKHGTEVGARFQEAEDNLHGIIFHVLGIDTSLLADVDYWDSWMLAWEQRDLVPQSHDGPLGWWMPDHMDHIPSERLQGWTPKVAEAAFLAQHVNLTEQFAIHSSQRVAA